MARRYKAAGQQQGEDKENDEGDKNVIGEAASLQSQSGSSSDSTIAQVITGQQQPELSYISQGSRRTGRNLQSRDMQEGINLRSKRLKKKKQNKGKAGNKGSVDADLDFPSLEDSPTQSKHVKASSEESIWGPTDQSYLPIIQRIRQIKQQFQARLSAQKNPTTESTSSTELKFSELLDCCHDVRRIHEYLSKNTHLTKTSKTVSRRTSDVLKYFVDSYGPILATPSTSSSHRKVLRQFHSRFVPLFTSALTYECLSQKSHFVGGGSIGVPSSSSISTNLPSKYLLVILSRVMLDIDLGGISNKDTLIQLVKTKALACISTLLSTCPKSLTSASRVLFCLADTVHLIAHSVWLCSVGELSELPNYLLFATLVDLLEPFNAFFAEASASVNTGTSGSDIEPVDVYRAQVMGYIDTMSTSSAAIRDLLESIRPIATSLASENQRVVFDLTKSLVKYLHYGITSCRKEGGLSSVNNSHSYISSLLSALCLTSEFIGLDSLSLVKPDLIRLGGVIIYDLNG